MLYYEQYVGNKDKRINACADYNFVVNHMYNLFMDSKYIYILGRIV
jgi:hypothetical protein